MGEIIYEQVKGRKIAAAMRFLVGGAVDDELTRRRAEALAAQTIHTYPDYSHLYWVRKGHQPVAAAMVFENAGRTGVLFTSPPSAPEVLPQALAELTRYACGKAIESGLSMVQSLLEPTARDTMAVLEAAGLQFLVELIYMRLDLRLYAPALDRPEIVWRTAEEAGRRELEAVIERTYERSLDVPAIEGLRRMSDIVASHRASGVYRPESWWLPQIDGRAIGCLLLNDCFLVDAADVVYLGVAPEFRGRGLGCAMLNHAAADAKGRGLSAMTLAVDARNRYARAAYAELGFTETMRRVAYAVLSPEKARKSPS